MELVKDRSAVLRKKRASKKPTTVAEFEQWEAKGTAIIITSFIMGK